jgi:hypothetical protein
MNTPGVPLHHGPRKTLGLVRVVDVEANPEHLLHQALQLLLLLLLFVFLETKKSDYKG